MNYEKFKNCAKCGREFCWRDCGSSTHFEKANLCPDCEHEEEENECPQCHVSLNKDGSCPSCEQDRADRIREEELERLQYKMLDIEKSDEFKEIS